MGKQTHDTRLKKRTKNADAVDRAKKRRKEAERYKNYGRH